MATRAAIVIEAREWLGSTWQHQASLKNVATDCLGLIAGVGLNVGVAGADKWRADARMRNYTRPPNPRLLLAACNDYLDPVPVPAVQLGDILLMRFGGEAQHFALVSSFDPMRIIHAYTSAGRVVETGLGGGWDKRVVRAYRYRGLDP